MGSPADLALSCRAESPVEGGGGNVFKAVPASMDGSDRAHILDDYLKALEEERSKIEAFKRELPHCMQLLEYAIDASRENLIHPPAALSPGLPIVSIVGKPTKTLGLFGKEIVQDFLRARWESVRKAADSEDDDKAKARKSSCTVDGDRPSWMAEAQLWSQPSLKAEQGKEKESSTEDSVRRNKDSAEKSTLTSPALLFNAKQRPGGAFTPFVKEKPAPNPPIRAKPGIPEFALSTGESRPNGSLGAAAVESEVGSVEASPSAKDGNASNCPGKEPVGRLNGTYSGGTGSTSTSAGAAQRKARRCWSPELHRRFVSALQQLGGSQVATPKQIRELMKVDGLTNDEVKSHLQKYRLHTRRPSPTPQGTQQQTPPQLVVLEGIWVPPEYGGAAAIYHDPASSVCQPEPIYCQPSISQEFHSQIRPSGVQIELQRSSPSHSSRQGARQSTSNPSSGPRPASGAACRDDSSGEEGKSESSSWKGGGGGGGEHAICRERSTTAEDMERKSGDEDEEGDHDDLKDEEDDEEDDEMHEADHNDREGPVRLQLEMSCSNVRDIKAEPLAA